jgi:transcriptional regulator with GAF, ATPase, and Fis domain
MTTPLSKADRLAIGAAVAPSVRRQADAPRKVTVVDKDGNPVRETTHVEVARAVLARSEIEFSVQEGKRPEWVTCKTCGAPVKVGKLGPVRRSCLPGTHRCLCGKPVGTAAKCGRGKLCRACTTRKAQQVARHAPKKRKCSMEAVREALKRHRNTVAAAKDLDLDVSRVRKYAKRLGIQCRRKRSEWVKYSDDTIREAVMAHKSMAAAARALGADEHTVRRRAKQLGVRCPGRRAYGSRRSTEAT